MSGCQNEILVEVPNDDLPELANLYKKKATWAPHMFTLVDTAIKWKKSEKYRDLIIFLSPENCWREDGTIIILLMFPKQNIFAFTLDDTCSQLYKGLSQTNQISYTPGTCFYAIHEKCIPTVKRFIEEKKFTIESEVPCFLYALPPEDSQKFTIECPTDVILKKLQPSDSKIIDDAWPHRCLNSDKYIGKFIEINGGNGVFLKSTNELIAWGIRHLFGNVTMLQTDTNHKRKGYASLILKSLAKEIGEDGYWCVLTVLPNNKSASGMFEKLGFSCIGTSTLITLE